MAVWQMFRSIAVTHNATRNDMVQDILTTGSSHAQKAAIGTLALAVLVSDALLVCATTLLLKSIFMSFDSRHGDAIFFGRETSGCS